MIKPGLSNKPGFFVDINTLESAEADFVCVPVNSAISIAESSLCVVAISIAESSLCDDSLVQVVAGDWCV